MKKEDNLFLRPKFSFIDGEGKVVWKEIPLEKDEPKEEGLYFNCKEEGLYLICEEEEEGVEEGCSPWPWVPCVYPPGNSKRTYKVTRRWYGREPLKGGCKPCEDKAELQKDIRHGVHKDC